MTPTTHGAFEALSEQTQKDVAQLLIEELDDMSTRDKVHMLLDGMDVEQLGFYVTQVSGGES